VTEKVEDIVSVAAKNLWYSLILAAEAGE